MLLIAALAIVLPAVAAPCCGAMGPMQHSATKISHPCCAPHCTMKVGSESQQQNDAVLTPASNFQSTLSSSDVVTVSASLVDSNIASPVSADSSVSLSPPSAHSRQLRI